MGSTNSSCCLLFAVGAPSTGTASLGTLGFGLKAPGTTTAATTSTATGKDWMQKVAEEKEA